MDGGECKGGNALVLQRRPRWCLIKALAANSSSVIVEPCPVTHMMVIEWPDGYLPLAVTVLRP